MKQILSHSLGLACCQQARRSSPSVRSAILNSREELSQLYPARNARLFSSSSSCKAPHQYRWNNISQKPSVSVIRDPVLRQVYQNRTPIQIYKAPNNKWYNAKVYGLAAICLGIGVYSIKFNDDIKGRDLAFFVRPTYVFVGLAFVAIGCYVCTAPSNRMRILEIIPNQQGGSPQLRMIVRSAPWTKERVVCSELGEATISEKTVPMVEEIVEADRARRQRVFEGLEQLSIPSRVWEGSARWVHQKWTSFFLRFKFAVLRFGIVKVEVQGEKWKIDCSGWLLEDGKAIDRIIAEE